MTSLSNETTATSTINNNFALVETALENTLSRDGTSPNTMNADLDMNSNNILNLPYPASNTEPLRLGDFADLFFDLEAIAADEITDNESKLVKVSDDASKYEYTAATITDAGALTLPVSINIGSSTTIDGVLDEDNMASNSATKLATQQSIKAYVDAQVTASNLDVAGDSGTVEIDLDSETLTIAGGTGITTTGATNTVTVDVDANVAYLPGQSGGQTLRGGTGSGDDLILSSTAHATKGTVRVGSATTGMFFDETNSRFSIGADEHTITLAGSPVATKLQVHTDGSESVCELHTHATGGAILDGPVIYGARSRGTAGAQTIVADDDYLFSVLGVGYDGTDYALAGQIALRVDGTPGSGDMPSRWEFYTVPDASETLTLAMTIGPTQVVTFANSPLVGASTILDTSDIGVSVQGFDADTLKADTADTLTAGFATTTDNDGTQSSGTYTPDEAGGNFKHIVNGGAFTLAPPTNDTNIVVQITNNASAGAITTSSFTIVTGDSFTTTNGDDFIAYITKINGFSHLNVVALQ